jgi:hypothetical protein
MKVTLFSRLYSYLGTASTFAILAMTSLSSNADWTSNAPPIQAGIAQDIVISFKSNPMSHPEAACLSVTLARSLRGGDPSANVTLFPTLDGVTIGDSKVVSSRRFKCNTPWGEVSLQENLEAFLNGNPNNMVICPLCWEERYGDQLPDYGVLNPPAVGALLLNAEKIIDF